MSSSEFDQYADEYYRLHALNISASGESPEFFHRYKIADAKLISEQEDLDAERILDFGCGIGNSIPHFRSYFPSSLLFCADASRRSLEIAGERFPGREIKVQVHAGSRLEFPDRHFDMCFSACVFHHIGHDKHRFWLSELHRITKSGGLLVIFEHNPFNPLTVRAVRTCPFDANARLVRAGALARSMIAAGWPRPSLRYRIFFPGRLSGLRKLERFLTTIPVGAQYSLHSVKTETA